MRMSSNNLKIVSINFGADENHLPMEENIRIKGDLKSTVDTSYDFNKDGRVIKRNRLDWFRMINPKTHPSYKNVEPNTPFYSKANRKFQLFNKLKTEYKETFVPQVMDYDFDVEISGQHKNSQGELEPMTEECGLFNTQVIKLYKNEAISDDYRLKKHRCTTQNCPICFRTHGSIRAKSTASKLWIVRDLELQEMVDKMLRNNAIPNKTIAGSTLNTKLYHCTIDCSFVPETFAEIDKMEQFIAEQLELYHEGNDLGYTLTIHPYSHRKDCPICGLTQSHQNWNCSECGEELVEEYTDKNGKTQQRTLAENHRWVLNWHWHLITNFRFNGDDIYTYWDEETGDYKNIPVFLHEMMRSGYIFVNISQKQKGKKIHGEFARGYIKDEDELARILSYEFSHAMYTPFKSRNIIRFCGKFHSGRFKIKSEEIDVLSTDEYGNRYYRVDIISVEREGMKVDLITTDTPVYKIDDNGRMTNELDYLYEKIRIYTDFRIKTKDERKRPTYLKRKRMDYIRVTRFSDDVSLEVLQRREELEQKMLVRLDRQDLMKQIPEYDYTNTQSYRDKVSENVEKDFQKYMEQFDEEEWLDATMSIL